MPRAFEFPIFHFAFHFSFVRVARPCHGPRPFSVFSSSAEDMAFNCMNIMQAKQSQVSVLYTLLVAFVGNASCLYCPIPPTGDGRQNTGGTRQEAVGPGRECERVAEVATIQDN